MAIPMFPWLLLLPMSAPQTALATCSQHKLSLVRDDDESDDDDNIAAPVPAPTADPIPTLTPGPGSPGASPIRTRPGLSTEAKAGIAVDVILGALIIFGDLLFICVRHRRRRRRRRLRTQQGSGLEHVGPFTHHNPEAHRFNNMPKAIPKNDVDPVAYQHMGGAAAKHALSSVTGFASGRPWSESYTVSTPSHGSGSDDSPHVQRIPARPANGAGAAWR